MKKNKKNIAVLAEQPMIVNKESAYPKAALLNDEFLNSLMDSAKIHNQFKYNVKQSLSLSSKTQFNDAYNEFEKYLNNKDDKEKSEHDISIILIKSISFAILDFIDSKEFSEEKTPQYLEVMDEAISPNLLALLLWTQNKKEGAFNILKDHAANFTSEQYDYIYETVRAKDYQRDLPLNIQERKEVLEKQKEEFLFCQSRYNLINDLSNMPSKNSSAKKPKI